MPVRSLIHRIPAAASVNVACFLTLAIAGPPQAVSGPSQLAHRPPRVATLLPAAPGSFAGAGAPTQWGRAPRGTDSAAYHVGRQGPIDSDEMAPYLAINPKQDLRAHFAAGAITLTPLSGRTSFWEVGLSLLGWGTTGEWNPVRRYPTVRSSGSVVDYDHGDVLERWENRPDGLEQTFRVKRPPVGVDPLRVRLDVRGDAMPRLRGPAIEFLAVKQGREPVLRYAGLRAFAHDGRELPSHLDLLGCGTDAVVPAGLREDRDAPSSGACSIEIAVEASAADYPVLIDPLATSPTWALYESSENSYFGSAVATGDLNGDGYADLIVGAPNYPYVGGDQTQEGAVLVYYGSRQGFQQTTWDWRAVGNQAGAYLGDAVATGDVNGDGLADLVVKSPNLDVYGAVFVYYGSTAGLSEVPSAVIRGVTRGVWQTGEPSIGYGDLTVGDIDGDGYSDIVVADQNYYLGGYPSGEPMRGGVGAVFAFHGSPTGPRPTPDWFEYGDSARAYFGRSLATGDFNADGYSDLLVGAYEYPLDMDPATGVAYLYYGSPLGLASTTPAWELRGPQAGDDFGKALASGDINADGYSDVLASAPDLSISAGVEGAILGYYGSSSGIQASSWDWRREADRYASWFGHSLAAGDVDGDGITDVLAGDPYYTHGQVTEGAVFVYRGSANGSSQLPWDWRIENDRAKSDLGYAVAAGDVDGDGIDDLVAGSPFDSADTQGDSAVFVYRGGPASPPLEAPVVTIDAPTTTILAGKATIRAHATVAPGSTLASLTYYALSGLSPCASPGSEQQLWNGSNNGVEYIWDLSSVAADCTMTIRVVATDTAFRTGEATRAVQIKPLISGLASVAETPLAGGIVEVAGLKMQVRPGGSFDSKHIVGTKSEKDAADGSYPVSYLYDDHVTVDNYDSGPHGCHAPGSVERRVATAAAAVVGQGAPATIEVALKTPLVLVHGIRSNWARAWGDPGPLATDCSEGSFPRRGWANELLDKGYVVFTPNHTYRFLSKEEEAVQIENQVEQDMRGLVGEAGVWPGYAVIAHSEGGVASRIWFNWYSAHRPVRIYAVGSPHSGTEFVFSEAYDLERTIMSEFNAVYGGFEEERSVYAVGGTKNWFGQEAGHDGVVIPQESAFTIGTLDGACTVFCSSLPFVPLQVFPKSPGIHEVPLNHSDLVGAPGASMVLHEIILADLASASPAPDATTDFSLARDAASAPQSLAFDATVLAAYRIALGPTESRDLVFHAGSTDLVRASCAATEGSVSFSLRTAAGAWLNAPGPGVEYRSDDWGTQFAVVNPVAGDWTMRVSAGSSGASVHCEASERSPFVFAARTDGQAYGPASQVMLMAELTTSSSGPTVSSIEADVRDATGQAIATVALYDDGNHEDGEPGDLVFAARWTAPVESGAYSALFTAEGTYQGGFFRRQAKWRFSVVQTVFTGTFGDTATDIDADGTLDHLLMVAGLRLPEAGEYVVSADLFSTDGYRVGHTRTRMVAAAGGDQQASLSFDLSRVGCASFGGALVVKSLRISLPIEGYRAIDVWTGDIATAGYDGGLFGCQGKPNPVPVASGVLPSRVFPGETANLTVLGSSFAPGVSVRMGPYEVTSVTRVTAQRLRVQWVVPPDATPAPLDVTVLNPDGRSGALVGGLSVVQDLPPTVSILYPTMHQAVTGSVKVTASVADDRGVARVEFVVGGTLIGAATSFPFQQDWDTSLMPVGTYTIVAIAYDSAGQSDSAEVIVEVVGGAPGGVGLTSGVPLPDSLAGAARQDTWKFYYIVVPAGTTHLDVTLDQLSADADVYVRSSVKPSLSLWDCRPYASGVDSELCPFTSPAPGTWWIGVNNWDVGTIEYRITATFSTTVTCTGFSIAPQSLSTDYLAVSTMVTITGSPSGCTGGNWTTAGNGSWITASPASGSGSGSATVLLTQNTGAQRTGSATIAGKSFTVTQGAAPPPACTSFAVSPTSAAATYGAGSTIVSVTGSPSGCLGGSWTAAAHASWLSVNPSAGTGPGAVTVSWQSNAMAQRVGTATLAGNTFTVNQGAAPGNGSGLIGYYFGTPHFAPMSLSRLDPIVEFAWGTGGPGGGIGPDQWSARWQGEVEAEFTETYTFWVYGDDGFQLYVDDILLIDRWLDQASEWSASVDLMAGRRHKIRLHYYDGYGPAALKLSWSSASTPKGVIPQSRLHPPRLTLQDLLWHHQLTGDLYVWQLAGVVTTSGHYTAPFRFADTLWQIRGLADFNRDGETDILWHHQGTGDLYVWYMHGGAAYAGSYLTPKSFADTRWQIRGVADFNADGQPDLLWHHQVTGDLYIWFMNATVVTGGSYLTPKSFADTRWQIRGVADFNRDGQLDLLWHHQGNGDLYVWHMTGTVVTSGSYLTPPRFADTRWKIVRVADFDGDGRQDLLWHHQGTGDLYVWFLDGVVVTRGSYLNPSRFSDTNWKVVPR